MKYAKTISYLILLISLSACQLEVPNLEFCRDKGELGAHCAYTNTSQTRNIPHEEWQALRFGMFCATEEDFAKNQKFVEQACQKVKNCNVEQLMQSYKALMENLK